MTELKRRDLAKKFNRQKRALSRKLGSGHKLYVPKSTARRGRS